MPKLSVCIVAKDEERNIGACLESLVPLAPDEVIVVDALSRDRTREIARERGARVIERPWPGHVEQKNFAMEQAANDWVLSLDADERLAPGLAEGIRRRLADPGSAPADAYHLRRRLFYLGRWIRFGGWLEWKIRLWRRSRGRWGGVNPHDRVVMAEDARVERFREGGEVLHYSFRDLSHQLKVLDSYTGIGARELRARGVRFRLRDLLIRPLVRFLAVYIFRAGFLDGMPGLIMAMNHAFAGFVKYARVWEAERVPAELAPAGPAPALRENFAQLLHSESPPSATIRATLENSRPAGDHGP